MQLLADKLAQIQKEDFIEICQYLGALRENRERLKIKLDRIDGKFSARKGSKMPIDIDVICGLEEPKSPKSARKSVKNLLFKINRKIRSLEKFLDGGLI